MKLSSQPTKKQRQLLQDLSAAFGKESLSINDENAIHRVVRDAAQTYKPMLSEISKSEYREHARDIFAAEDFDEFLVAGTEHDSDDPQLVCNRAGKTIELDYEEQQLLLAALLAVTPTGGGSPQFSLYNKIREGLDVVVEDDVQAGQLAKVAYEEICDTFDITVVDIRI